MGKKKWIATIVTAIVIIASSMDYLNTFHEFMTWTAKLFPDGIVRTTYQLSLEFVMQPVTVAGFSFPLALALLASAVVGNTILGRRRRRNRLFI